MNPSHFYALAGLEWVDHCVEHKFYVDSTFWPSWTRLPNSDSESLRIHDFLIATIHRFRKEKWQGFHRQAGRASEAVRCCADTYYLSGSPTFTVVELYSQPLFDGETFASSLLTLGADALVAHI